jgi:DNA-binding MarR family transcriptional regulator
MSEPTPEGQVWACNCMALRRAARRISQRYDEALAPAGLRATQYSILSLVHGVGERKVAELAEELELDPTTMGKNLRPLERDGLIAIRLDPNDRRGRLVRLTDRGSALLQRAYPLWQAAQQRFEAQNGSSHIRELRMQLSSLVMEPAG